MNKLAIYAAMALLGNSAFTATPPSMEPIQMGAEAFKNAEALRKAQDKRDRKAAKRLANGKVKTG